MIKAINTNLAAPAIGPYSQAVQVGDLIFTSGQLAADKDGKIVADDIKGQALQVMKNLQTILEAAGSDFAHVIKTTIFLKDMNDFATVNEIYGSFFTEHKPARSTIEVARLPKDVKIEIEMIAQKKV